MAKSEYVKQRDKENREWCKARGICPKCGHEYAEPGKVLCYKCAERERNRQREKAKADPDYNEKHRIQRQKREERYLQEGLCAYCGKRAVYPNHKTCYLCLIRQRKSWRKYIEKNKKGWREAELCLWCGAERADGYQLCPACLEKARERAKLATQAGQAARKEGGHPWQVAFSEKTRAIQRAKSASENTEKSLLLNGL